MTAGVRVAHYVGKMSDSSAKGRAVGRYEDSKLLVMRSVVSSRREESEWWLGRRVGGGIQGWGIAGRKIAEGLGASSSSS